jgi:hypothetical protein
LGELPQVSVSRLDPKAPDVDKYGDAVGEKDAGAQELEVVVRNERPHRELGAISSTSVTRNA